jgi:hypothetical protein
MLCGNDNVTVLPPLETITWLAVPARVSAPVKLLRDDTPAGAKVFQVDPSVDH